MYCSPNIVKVIKSRRLRLTDHVAIVEDVRSALGILTGTPTGKRPFRKPRRRWEDNIRMDLNPSVDLIEIGISTRNWVDSAHGRDYWSAL